MISLKWVLYSKSGDVLKSEEVKKNGNEMYLCQDKDEYQLLNEITEVDIERFFPEHMNDLMDELINVKLSLTDEQEINHLDEILRLCSMCRDCIGSQVIFNPFSDIVELIAVGDAGDIYGTSE
jgi:uncharacterized membrane protein YheB (UPF0754 family)